MEGHDGHVMSRLAAASVRGLITAQVTEILAGTGKTRWCELVGCPPRFTVSAEAAIPGQRLWTTRRR